MTHELDASADVDDAQDVRTRIVLAAARLIADGGRDAATTRAVAVAAGVQAPTIYRLFGDKRGLLDAVAQHELASYVAAKALLKPHADPVQALRDGWDMHIAFGLTHPELYRIMSAGAEAGPLSTAVAAGQKVLRKRLQAIALAGRLRVSEDRAVALLEAGTVGTVFTLLGQSRERRDPGLSHATREAVIAAITGETIGSAGRGPSGAAAALRAGLDQTSVLTPGEMHLLEELLDRIADGVQRL